ncbi:MAG: type 4a pilus biogenesis protein PilO [Acidimicrobiales bacterium]
MIDSTVLKKTIKRPRVLLSIVAAVVIVLIWAVAFFIPEGNKISSLKAEQATIDSKMAIGNAKVSRYRHTYQHSAQLKTVQTQLNAAVPADADAYNYVQSLSAAAGAAGVHLTAISISSTPSRSSTPRSAALEQTPVTMTVKGTYDQLLSLITKIYKLPRLTDIDGMDITGGGATSNRSTILSASFTLMAFSAASPTSSSSGG